jgi:integrase
MDRFEIRAEPIRSVTGWGAGIGLAGVALYRPFETSAPISLRLADGLPSSTCCHTFRATGITAYLENGGTIENAQAIAAHESPRTTKLYDRTDDEITLDEVERIVI